MYAVRCKEDGTWEAYDPEYEDFKADQAYDEYKRSNTSTVSCRDVTSYDYNWDNDMLCTRPDGTQFYTSYDGANQY